MNQDNSSKTKPHYKLYKGIFDASLDPMIILDENGIIRDVNGAFCALYGFKKEDLVSNHIFFFDKQIHTESFTKMMCSEVRDNGKWQGEIWARTKYNKPLQHYFSLKELKDHKTQSSFFLGVFYDISQKKQFKEKTKNLEDYDLSIGISNKDKFYKVLVESLNDFKDTTKTLSVLILNLNGFKMINQSMGYQMGDILLKEIIDRIGNVIKDNGFIARLNGTTFAILVKNPQKIEDIISIINNIIYCFNEPFMVNNEESYITCRIGVSVYPNDGEDAKELIKKAEIAMNEIRDKTISDYRIFNYEMEKKIHNEILMTNNLRKAIDEEQFVLYYQPQLDLNTNEIVGLEALIRWIHPTLGLIPPNDFIPIAEKTGLIIPMSEWIIKQACIDTTKLIKMFNKKLRVSINISALQFQQENFIDYLRYILNETNLSSDFFGIEITESVSIQDLDLTIDTLQKLNQLGVKVSMDDFGKGYSSLSYLKELPLNVLKIDRSFINNITNNQSEAAITTAIITMCHSLNLKVIAEGVETKEQLDFLKAKNCDQIQGFYISRPLAISDLEKFINEYTP